ncbi:hypothetical protein ACWEWD_09855 [Streptomyces tendae]
MEDIDPLHAGANGIDRLTRGPLTTIVTFVRRAGLTPEIEYVKDCWDLTVFGHAGTIDFSDISQPWLKETSKRWTRHTAPQLRGENAGASLRKQVNDLRTLSQSLRARTDHGDRPAELGRQDIEHHLSEALGQHIWHSTGIGPPADIDRLHIRITELEQQNLDLRLQLEETNKELSAARAANRELTKSLNQHHPSPPDSTGPAPTTL